MQNARADYINISHWTKLFAVWTRYRPTRTQDCPVRTSHSLARTRPHLARTQDDPLETALQKNCDRHARTRYRLAKELVTTALPEFKNACQNSRSPRQNSIPTDLLELETAALQEICISSCQNLCIPPSLRSSHYLARIEDRLPDLGAISPIYWRSGMKFLFFVSKKWIDPSYQKRMKD